jgi:hypothetical protein
MGKKVIDCGELGMQEVNACNECPECGERKDGLNFFKWCYEKGKFIPDVDIIPEWCPLDDF